MGTEQYIGIGLIISGIIGGNIKFRSLEIPAIKGLVRFALPLIGIILFFWNPYVKEIIEPPKILITGKVFEMGDTSKGVPDSRVYLQLGLSPMPEKIPEICDSQGVFSIEINNTFRNKTAIVWAFATNYIQSDSDNIFIERNNDMKYIGVRPLPHTYPIYNANKNIFSTTGIIGPLLWNFNPNVRTISISPIIGRTSKAKHSGVGDNDLKKWNTTQLNGTICLRKTKGNLIIEVRAKIREKISDHTTFVLTNTYKIYQPPNGWHITAFKVKDASSNCYEFSRIQSTWTESVPVKKAIISLYTWTGNTSLDDDSIEGCWIGFNTNKITVTISKN